MTNLIKNATKSRVCAIGDGGNDVGMIQEADVGIGIVGKEGQQASLAADFSVTQFGALTRCVLCCAFILFCSFFFSFFDFRLLLWHGRNSYQRSAKLSQFIIHRGLIISFIQVPFPPSSSLFSPFFVSYLPSSIIIGCLFCYFLLCSYCYL